MSEKGEKAVQQMLDKTAGSKETLQQPQSQLTKTPSAVTDYDTDAESHSVKNDVRFVLGGQLRSEEHTSELQSRPHISYAVFCLKKKNNKQTKKQTTTQNKKTT